MRNLMNLELLYCQKDDKRCFDKNGEYIIQLDICELKENSNTFSQKKTKLLSKQ